MNTPAQWTAWSKAAKDAARVAAKEWLSHSMIVNVVIHGPIGTLTPGGLRSTSDFRSSMIVKMQQNGVPMPITLAFCDALSQAWNAWFEGYTVQLSYPTFAAVAGHVAPPTPCVPQPLKSGASLNAHRLTPFLLAADIQAKLGKAGAEGDASKAVDDFANWFSERFSAWRSVALLVNVMGKGPVPTFAPPYVPVGPVVGGDTLSVRPLSHYGVFDMIL